MKALAEIYKTYTNLIVRNQVIRREVRKMHAIVHHRARALGEIGFAKRTLALVPYRRALLLVAISIDIVALVCAAVARIR